MPAWLYDAGPQGLWIFLIVTLLMGGAAAFVSGRAIAETWRPVWHIPAYMLLLAASVRFVQYAVFGTVLLSPRNYLVDLVVLLALAVAGYRSTRRRQMARQYGWLGADKLGQP